MVVAGAAVVVVVVEEEVDVADDDDGDEFLSPRSAVDADATMRPVSPSMI